MRAIVGIVVGAIAGIVIAYVFAIAAGSSSPLFVLFLPLGIILGWRVAVSWGTVKRCGSCSEEIRREAVICKHCGQLQP